MNEELYYLNNGEWVDEMLSDKWEPIMELFGLKENENYAIEESEL